MAKPNLGSIRCTNSPTLAATSASRRAAASSRPVSAPSVCRSPRFWRAEVAPTPRAELSAGRTVASSFSVGAGSASLKRGTRSRTHRPIPAATIGPSRRRRRAFAWVSTCRCSPGRRIGSPIVRSVHHPEAGHRNAAYWNLTGHAPHRPGNDETIAPSRRDWPCLGAQVARFRNAPAGLPANVAIPYPLADRGMLNGQDAGFLGRNFDPMLIHPGSGRAYAGVSPSSGMIDLRLPGDIPASRLGQRGRPAAHRRVDSSRTRCHRSGSFVATLSRHGDEPAHQSRGVGVVRHHAGVEPGADGYGDHVCGQSALMARRLTEAGVPLVTVYSSAGDLNGCSGDHWDTHGNNFNRLRRRPAAAARAGQLRAARRPRRARPAR